MDSASNSSDSDSRDSDEPIRKNDENFTPQSPGMHTNLPISFNFIKIIKAFYYDVAQSVGSIVDENTRQSDDESETEPTNGNTVASPNGSLSSKGKYIIYVHRLDNQSDIEVVHK